MGINTSQITKQILNVLLAALMAVGAFGARFPDTAGASNASQTLPATDGTLLQFTSQGHVIGFYHAGVIVTSADHMLKMEFLNARIVAPIADKTVVEENMSDRIVPLSRITYTNLWDGVTVVYESREGSVVKSTYYINAISEGVPAASIRLRYNRPVRVDEQGNLVISYDNGAMVESAPIAWQVVEGLRKPVTVSYLIYGEREVGFSLGDRVKGIPVVIDPVLVWNTFLGGSGSSYGESIAVDGSGNVYVAGHSNSTWGSPVRAYTPGFCAFAAKLDSSGNLIWNTFLGTSNYYLGCSIALDSGGHVYIDGTANSNWGNPIQPYISGNNVFAAKLDNSGNLIWNTFLGASGDNCWSGGIAVDGSGNVYVAGNSIATWGSPVRAYTGNDDAFVARLDSSGNLTWNTFLGGDSDDFPTDIAVDSSGNAYVTGWSYAAWGNPRRAFTTGEIPGRTGDGQDAFVAKLDSSGNLTWNTFLGGSWGEMGMGIAVDSSGNVYVSGENNATWGSMGQASTNSLKVFVAKLDSSGDLTWNTFLTGLSCVNKNIAVDSSGNIYTSVNRPSIVNLSGYEYDTFVYKLDNDSNLTWSTFVGGTGDEYNYGIAIDGSRNVYVTGYSYAAWGSPVRAYTGGQAAYVAKISNVQTALTSFTPTSGSVGSSIIINGTNFTGATAVTFGGVAAASYTINSPTQITAVVGSGTTGKVSVTTPNGTAISVGNFNLIGGAAKLAFTVQPGNQPPGYYQNPQLVVAVQDSNGNAVNSVNSVFLSIGNNPGGGTVTVTNNPLNSLYGGEVLYANVTIDKAGDGYTLTASSDGLTPATSNAFNIGPAAPAVTNASGATNITANSATLNGYLNSDGGSSTSVTIYWGNNDGGTTAENWDHNVPLGIIANYRAFSTPVTGLTGGTNHYYRCSATNSTGTSWATTSSSFFTNVGPTNISIYGYMGIGTDSPQRPLHLFGNACLFERNQDSAGFIIKRTAVNRWVFGVDELPQPQFVIKTYPEGQPATVRMSISTDGSVNIGGTLSKSSGTFRIDHPLDPANKYLSHSFVESPDMLNVYNGNAVLDWEGKAVVELPAYFEALNRDYSYQLEGVGSYAPLYIAQEIKDNSFIIAGGKPGMKVSWQVVGIRKDPYANAHPVIVEQEKPIGEMGAVKEFPLDL